MKKFLVGALLGFVLALGVGAYAANVPQTFVGSMGITTTLSNGGRTVTLSPSPSQTVSGTTYTFANGDCGREKTFTSGTAVTATIPATLPLDCNIAVLQAGAGTVSVNGTAVTAATLHSNGGLTHTAAQWSVLSINVYSNVGGSAAIAVISGDAA